MVFAVVIVGELLAFILTLAPFKQSIDRWSDLSFTSLFIQWVMLSSAALLCISRPFLQKLNEKVAALLCYGLLVSCTGVFSEIAFWLTEYLGLGWNAGSTLHADLLFRNLAISSIISALALHYFYVQHQWKRHIQAESEAKIQALQARIRPHFLFNSMNTIASLTRTNPATAEEAVEDLADLFRVSLADARNQIPLSEEINLTKNYLRIEQLRLGDRLHAEWNINSLPDDCLIPALSIQPLIENAIFHGIEPLSAGGIIQIDGKLQNGVITIRITNPVHDNISTNFKTGNQIALENTKLRFEAFYGPKGKIRTIHHNNHFEVIVSFPYQTAEQHCESINS